MWQLNYKCRIIFKFKINDYTKKKQIEKSWLMVEIWTLRKIEREKIERIYFWHLYVWKLSV
jgi:hypothetical protein